MPTLLGLCACTSPTSTDTGVVAGLQGVVELAMVNPTDADPLAGVDELVLEIREADVRVYDASFTWPADTIEMPDLTHFGVVRFALIGKSGGEIVSAGLSREVALQPGATQRVPVLVLPVNEAIPLTHGPATGRAAAATLALPDGGVLLAGGRGASGFALDSIERFDVELGFETLSATLGSAAWDISTLTTPEGEQLLIGGMEDEGDVDADASRSRRVQRYAFAQRALFGQDGMVLERSAPCVAAFGVRDVMVLGGIDHAAPSRTGEWLRRDADGDSWGVTEVTFQDLDAGAVTGCAGDLAGGVFTMGEDAESTGTWLEERGGGPGEGFAPLPSDNVELYTDGSVLAPMPDGTIWVGGGLLLSSATVIAEGRRVDIGAGSMVPDVDLSAEHVGARHAAWGDDGWVAVGCGWRNPGRTQPQPVLELLSPMTGEVRAPIPLGDMRSDCGLTPLPGGSVLIIGGEGFEDSALIVRPWPPAGE